MDATTQSPEGDLSYRQLVERVVAGDVKAWTEFVERFSKLLFSLLWRYANGDQDQCADLYLYVVDGLHQSSETGETFYRLRRYLASLGRFQGKGRLTTWLGRVTQNLVSDFFREQEGRKTLPRDIQRMDLTHQKVFKLLYWDCFPEREAFSTLQSAVPQLTRERFDRMVDRINRTLKNCNRWAIYSEVLRRTPALPLHPTPEDGDGAPAIQAADLSPAANPGTTVANREDQESARKLGRRLREILVAMPKENRLLLVCRFKHGMTAGEIARILRRDDEKKIYAESERLRTEIQNALTAAGFRWEAIADGVDALEGLLDEFEPAGLRAKAGRA
jgi:RNA polymerase sigma factor (sigma-70 family)